MDDEGKYPDYLIRALQFFENYIRPFIIFIQTRMTPYRLRQNYPRVFFLNVPAFSFVDTKILVGSKLKLAKISFENQHQSRIAELVDGHPINVDFAVRQISMNGGNVELFIKNPKDLILWKNKRAFDYISQIQLDSAHKKTIALLLLYNALPTELLLELNPIDLDKFTDMIRSLQDWHCIQFINGVYTITPPLLDAFQRDNTIKMSDTSEVASAERIISFIEHYKNDDEANIALLEPMIIASLRSKKLNTRSLIRTLVLPSHLLMLGREAYNNTNYDTCMDYCDRALKNQAKMSKSALIEAYRLLGMSAARRGRKEEHYVAVAGLSKVGNRHAVRTRLFLLGFERRINGDLVAAEVNYLKCFDTNERNFAVCRELSQVYLSLYRFDEADTYARIAYQIAPTNPYVIDILVGVKLEREKNSANLAEDLEFQALMEDLSKYAKDKTKAFYLARHAQLLMGLGRHKEALKFANDAVDCAGGHLFPYLMRARILLRRGNQAGAERDIKNMQRLIFDNESQEDKIYSVAIFEIEFDVHIRRRQYRQAYNLVERISGRVPYYLKNKLSHDLSTAVKFDHHFHDTELRIWADNQ